MHEEKEIKKEKKNYIYRPESWLYYTERKIPKLYL